MKLLSSLLLSLLWSCRPMASSPQFATQGESPLIGPIYWARVVSYQSGSTIAFDSGQPIPIRANNAWTAGTCAGWDRIELTGQVEIEYSSDPNAVFPGTCGPYGEDQLSLNAFDATLSNFALPAGGGNVIAIRANGTATLKIKRITIYNRGAVAGGFLYHFNMESYNDQATIGGGPGAVPLDVRAPLSSFDPTVVQAISGGTLSAPNIDQIMAQFDVWVPAAETVSDPFVIDYDGIVIPIPTITLTSPITTSLPNGAVVLRTTNGPAGHDGKLSISIAFALL